MQYDLSGTEDDCATAGSAGNSCGIHIHSGTSCADTSAPGGHYHSSDISDPWGSIVYTSQAGNVAKGVTEVDYDFDYSNSWGHVFVMHGYDGGRRTCRQIPYQYTVNDLGTYPGYSGSGPTGAVDVTLREDGADLSWNLSGMETDCATPGSGNSCGIHIHSGFSCADASFVGGHFHRVESDPWGAGQVTADADGNSVGSVSITYGADIWLTVGRPLVVHGFDAGRRTCAFIGEKSGTTVKINQAGTYPGYSGDQLSGTVNLIFTGTEVQMQYDLSGTEDDCATAGSAGNSCGIHIHSGTSCADTSAPGGHYHSSDISDPWGSIVYTSQAGNVAKGVTEVDYDFDYSNSWGHVFVMHGYDGGRRTCRQIPYQYTVNDLGTYPGYSGSGPTGAVDVTLREDGADLSWNLSGMETDCATPGSGNSCGIHIHQGFGCDDASFVGGHFYKTEVDPWGAGQVTADAGGNSVGSVSVTHDADVMLTAGRSVVIHGFDAGRRTCATVGSYTGTKVDISAPGIYPTWTGDAYTGSISMILTGTVVTMMYDITGTEAECSDADTVTHSNSCGIHFHKGYSCATNDLVSGHYFVGTDPWGTTSYVSDGAAGGSSKGIVEADYGATLDDSQGRAFVLHNYEGARVTCVAIPDGGNIVQMTALGRYPTFTDASLISGEVTLAFLDTSVTITYNLANVPTECTTAGSAGNSCGIHIHNGTSCDTNEEAGGHRWLEGEDPWKNAAYVTTDGTNAEGVLTVDNGYGQADNVGHAFVIHDYSGARVTCMVIGDTPTSNFQTYL